ncbi:MAG: nucleotide exchange factor GrpE [Polyangiaceae bacterium]
MNEANGIHSDNTSLEGIVARIEELTREVRRQGRAAVAAQAAAESCLEKLSEEEDPGSEPRDESPAPDERWIHALLPVADALDRMVAQATAMVDRRPAPPPPRNRLLALFAPSRPQAPALDRGPDLAILAEGLRVLRAQLGAALESCDVQVDRRTGVPLDPEMHRVVEVRPLRAGEEPDVVLEIVRPGYAAGDRVLREAEVVAGQVRGGNR